MTEHFDIIIIGTGAGGSTMVRALAPTGKWSLLVNPCSIPIADPTTSITCLSQTAAFSCPPEPSIPL